VAKFIGEVLAARLSHVRRMEMVKAITLARVPNGVPVADDFALVELPLAAPAESEVLIRNLYASVDPYMRLTMGEPALIGQIFGGGGLGRVEQSRHAGFAEGQLVRHRMGFRTAFVSDGGNLTAFRYDPSLPIPAQMSALGGIGLCAYGGLLHTGKLQRGEQVFVSAAAGAVGSLAVQVARLHGCYVIGSTGDEAKADWLRSIKVDAVINYRTQDLQEALATAAPRGIDVYFENVGGAHLDAAIFHMNRNGRVPVCGMISAYNSDGSVVRHLHEMIIRRVRIEGFGFDQFYYMQEQFEADMIGWMKSGELVTRETILDGIERVPEALIGLFSGMNTGKMLVRLAQ
jgi:NADPH-dependent curcumin reductase CurA